MLLYLLFKLIVIDFNEVILKYIKIYHSSFFFTHLYIKKKIHSENKSSIYTEKYIFDTYIFGTDYIILWSAGADPGGGGGTRRAPPKIGKNKIFWRKIVIFHKKYPKIFRASLRSVQFF
jgi:hypothetical protein